jgi:predicted Rossmann fold nucleotide-binding protein DprA/Smf involved in DNA uptake
MTRITDNAKAVIALTTRLGNSGRPGLSPTRWHRFAAALADADMAPSEIFTQGFDPALPGVPADIVESVRQLLGDAAAATVAAADLGTKGIWTLTITDGDYPDALVARLGRLAPPVLFGVGPKELLQGGGLAVVGSRDVSEAGAAAAGAIAAVAAAAGLTLVSGGARGVDQLAMNAAFTAGGNVLGILADSLEARIRRPEILRALDTGTTALITQQAPAAGFTPGSATGRNKLIFAFSRATVVIASDLESGGTWSGAVEALEANNGRVLVWRGEGEGPGNQRLEQLGARPVTSANDVLNALAEPPQPVPEQLSLTD